MGFSVKTNVLKVRSLISTLQKHGGGVVLGHPVYGSNKKKTGLVFIDCKSLRGSFFNSLSFTTEILFK